MIDLLNFLLAVRVGLIVIGIIDPEGVESKVVGSIGHDIKQLMVVRCPIVVIQFLEQRKLFLSQLIQKLD